MITRYRVFLNDKGYYSGVQSGWRNERHGQPEWSLDVRDAMNMRKDEAERIAAAYGARVMEVKPEVKLASVQFQEKARALMAKLARLHQESREDWTALDLANDARDLPERVQEMCALGAELRHTIQAGAKLIGWQAGPWKNHEQLDATIVAIITGLREKEKSFS